MNALRVLHVEDESDIREVVEISLGLDSGFLTRSCSSGKEALAAAAVWPPDIILLDVMMPVMDGPSTLKSLRSNPRTAHIPVVFMTARAQSRELDLFRSLGVVGVIPKPFDPMTLAASVRRYAVPADDGLRALRNVFLRRVDDDAIMLAKYRSALDQLEPPTSILADIRDIAHGLAGSGGIFGFREIGDIAASLEEAIIDQTEYSASCFRITNALDRLLTCISRNNARGKAPVVCQLRA